MKSPFSKNQSTDEIEKHIISKIKAYSISSETPLSLDPLIEKIGDAQFVLLGEASHGTHEYYTWRAAITKRLITEKGFSFIGVEGDWPDCYRLNRYVKGYPKAGESAHEVLHYFRRWPTWMWANWEMVALVEWLKQHNDPLPRENKVGFYGLDVYSLGESIEVILKYLKKTNAEAFLTAQKAAACFEPYGYEGIDYTRDSQMVPKSCENEVVDLLKEIRNNISRYNTDPETGFSTEQNALVAKNAEKYYRKMIKGGPFSWNIRDRHMVDTLNRLLDFHENGAKAIVWAHNTHIGDARATDMTKHGMVNVGEMVTSQHENKGVVKLGFGSYKGAVIADRNWGDVMRKMNVPQGIEGSWEYLLHKAGKENKLLFLDQFRNEPVFDTPIGHRAIGVVYHPEREQLGNYVPSVIPRRYDVFIYLDHTQALNPLHIKPDGHQVPETFPWGF
ncbi:erythromycin esterase family protein [Echinicola jeungdonensis]|uniref:Erythromycin esterase family protein n=1 Tax=Echinicola jeungdonensis TaxID=709343 RepID=A0ABV5J0L2_9BACT|nr:erythromycin esterase family protein [Echinicola jeungdonensis]MDN3671103.1 erythromycin esterase family protein [Echinicola jeungdonensis]